MKRVGSSCRAEEEERKLGRPKYQEGRAGEWARRVNGGPGHRLPPTRPLTAFETSQVNSTRLHADGRQGSRAGDNAGHAGDQGIPESVIGK